MHKNVFQIIDDDKKQDHMFTANNLLKQRLAEKRIYNAIWESYNYKNYSHREEKAPQESIKDINEDLPPPSYSEIYPNK